MKKIIIATILLLCAASFSCIESKAQNLKKLRKEYKKTPPKAVIVELFTWQAKLEYYKNTNQNEKYEITKNDIQQVMERTIADFNDNFSYCPVYFFIDTNYKAILNQDFQGALLDKDLQPAKDINVQKGDTNYFIVHYGSLAPDETTIKGWKTNGSELPSSTVSATGNKKFLVVSNYRFKQLPKYSTIRKADVPGYASYKKDKSSYKYDSPISDISYKPRAGALSNMLRDFYNED